MEHHAREIRQCDDRASRATRARSKAREQARHWRGGLAAVAAVAGLVTLAAVGCASTSSPPGASGGTSPSPGAGGVVSPPPGGGSGGATGPGGASLSTSQRAGITGGALFGGDVPLVSEQGELGRRLAIIRVYDHLGEDFMNPQVRRFMSGGSTLLVSLDTLPGGASYASIAAGHEDATISGFLRSVEQAAAQYRLGAIYICFEHEADTGPHHIGLGTPAQFVQAWEHIHQLATDAHLDWNQGGRLHWVLILTHGTYIAGTASQYWPGSNEVDIVGVDGYNTADCRAATGGNMVAQGTAMQTPADLFGAVLGFARTHGNLPVFVAEWASVPYASLAIQPGFIHQMQEYVAANPVIAAAMYWNGHGQGNGCDYSLNSRLSSLTALAAMGLSAALQGRVPSA
ncbi:MAG TPA: hypothetical protein VGL63_09715 [Streptosporangiaceae bacterium]|jgi:hypothetical protein